MRSGAATHRLCGQDHQIGVFASYVSHRGHAFIDQGLYLPKGWTGDPKRLKAANVPDEVGFATKLQIARMIDSRKVTGARPTKRR